MRFKRVIFAQDCVNNTSVSLFTVIGQGTIVHVGIQKGYSKSHCPMLEGGGPGTVGGPVTPGARSFISPPPFRHSWIGVCSDLETGERLLPIGRVCRYTK